MTYRLLFFSVLLWSQALFAADLYVSTTGSDSNSGTQSAPLKTIPRASQLARPGDTIRVAPGTYIGGFTTSVSGTSSAPIVYLSTVKWGAKIVPGSSGTTAWRNTGNYSTISGFDIDGQTGSLWRIGVDLSGTYQTLQDSHVHNIWGSSIKCDPNGGAAIVTDGYDGQHHHYILNNQINKIGGGNPGTGCSVSGIYLQGNTSFVKNNLVFDVTHTGIQAYHDATRADIVNNTVFNCDRGIVMSASGLYHLTTAPDYFNVHNNIVYRNSGYGIVEAAGPLGIGQNNSYWNNLSYGNGNTNLVVSAGNQDSTSGNISVEPQFVNYISTGGGDYRLKSTSPAIDKGNASLAPSKDLEGKPRPQGAGFDIGAYEYGGSAPAPTPAPTSTPIPLPTPTPVPTSTPSVKVNATQFAPGALISITVTAQGTNATEWVALYLASAPDSAWSYQARWMYLNGTKTQPTTPIKSATLQMTAPLEPGTYNIRQFGSTGYGQKIAMTANFAVVNSPVPSANSSELGVVGDKVVNGVTELCDDGNTVSGDGCSSQGTIETGFSCTGEPSLCGKFVYVGGSGSGDTFRCVGSADHVALNNAMAYVNATPGFVGVRIRAGVVCTISDTVRIHNSKTLEGETGAKIRLANGAQWQAWKPMITSASSSPMNITVRGFQIDGNRVNQAEPSGKGYYNAIDMQNVAGFTAHDLHVLNSLGDSINTKGTKLHFFRNRCENIGHDCYYIMAGSSNIRIHDDPLMSSGTNTGIRVVETRNTKIYRNKFNNIAGACVQIQGFGANVEVFENDCRNAVQGIWAFAYGSRPASDLTLNIHHNVFTSSKDAGSRTHGILVNGFNATIENNVIWGVKGNGISNTHLYTTNPSGSGYVVKIQNNIISSNTGYGIYNQYPGTDTYQASYNCVFQNSRGNFAGLTAGVGTVNAEPLFVSPPMDFHLRAGSPCINAGNPTSSYSLEPAPNGGRIDIGRYGNTSVSGATSAVP